MPIKKILTLCIVHQGDRVLLGMKKRGFGEGRWNGFGGKIEEGEDIESAMKRELQEEAGIIVSDFEKRGILEFVYEDDDTIMETHLFCVKEFEGEPVETEEMKPQWFSKAAVPFEEMWPDDKHWFPLFLEGKCFEGIFRFKDKSIITDYTLKEVDSLP
ncbi:MAG: 8-oxo-dGTP diphosphatase [bacterium]|nr:8-oxo-dGTP diphosphatase [bacterium]